MQAQRLRPARLNKRQPGTYRCATCQLAKHPLDSQSFKLQRAWSAGAPLPPSDRVPCILKPRSAPTLATSSLLPRARALYLSGNGPRGSRARRTLFAARWAPIPAHLQP
jgi:hypothetical protein